MELKTDSRGYIGPAQYSNQVGLIHHLVPYEHLSSDPWDELHELQTYLKEMPRTSSTWNFAELPLPTNGIKAAGRLNTLSMLTGSWPMMQTAKNCRWVNPYHPHVVGGEIDWTPITDRYEHWTTMADLGLFSQAEAAARYNVHPITVEREFERNNDSWDARKRMGRQNLANTIVATREWTGRTLADMAGILGTPRTTLSSLVRNNQVIPPPERPCDTRISQKW